MLVTDAVKKKLVEYMDVKFEKFIVASKWREHADEQFSEQSQKDALEAGRKIMMQIIDDATDVVTACQRINSLGLDLGKIPDLTFDVMMPEHEFDHEDPMGVLTSYKSAIFIPIMDYLDRGYFKWTPENHQLGMHGQDIKMEVYQTMLCWSLGGAECALSVLPVEVLFAIFDWVCRPPFKMLKRCFRCNSLHKPKKCSKCKLVFFCSVECQRASNDSHKRFCTDVSNKVYDKTILTEMRQAVREMIGNYDVITPGSMFYKDYETQCKRLRTGSVNSSV